MFIKSKIYFMVFVSFFCILIVQIYVYKNVSHEKKYNMYLSDDSIFKLLGNDVELISDKLYGFVFSVNGK